MKRYDTYKDSCVEWIGEIPAEWETKSLKYLSEITLGKMLCPEDKGGYLLKPYLKSKNIGRGKLILSSVDEMWFSRSELNSYRLEKEDILLSEGGEVGKVAFWNNDLDECYIQNSVHRIRVDKKYYKRYFFYYLTHLEASGFYKSIVSQVSIAHLTKEKLVKVPCIVPNKSEQIRIASYLDNKSIQIDQIIQQKELLLDKLQAKRHAIINEAVTKGLNSTATMKQSGIEWLGVIPEHWAIKKLSLLTSKIGDGIHTTPNYVDESEYYFINGNNLVNGKIILNGITKCVSEQEYKSYKLDIKEGTLLLSINGTIGNLAFFNNEKVILGKSAAYIECSNSLVSKYLFYLAQSNYIKEEFELSLSGTTIKNLSLYTLRNLKVLLPSIEEQNEIVNYLDFRISQVMKLESKITDQIDKLKQYRQSLISEVVTGKIKVD